MGHLRKETTHYYPFFPNHRYVAIAAVGSSSGSGWKNKKKKTKKQMAKRPVVIDVGVQSLTVAWEAVEGASCYELQWKDVGTDGEESEFLTISKALSAPRVRKRNVPAGPRHAYIFRWRIQGGEFSAPSDPPVSSIPQDAKDVLHSPFLIEANAREITVGWEKGQDPCEYELQVRRALPYHSQWQTLSQKLRKSACKKKNLDPCTSYIFRVRINGSPFWSVSSPAFSTSAALHSCYVSMLGPELLLNKSGVVTKVSTASLRKSIVAILFSASWCPPCKTFTPQLAQFYASIRASGRRFEVIFLSLDREERSFSEYFLNHHPWLAIPYSCSARTTVPSYFKVQGIPSLIIFDWNGQVIERNGVGKMLTVDTFDAWERAASKG